MAQLRVRTHLHLRSKRLGWGLPETRALCKWVTWSNQFFPLYANGTFGLTSFSCPVYTRHCLLTSSSTKPPVFHRGSGNPLLWDPSLQQRAVLSFTNYISTFNLTLHISVSLFSTAMRPQTLGETPTFRSFQYTHFASIKREKSVAPEIRFSDGRPCMTSRCCWAYVASVGAPHSSSYPCVSILKCWNNDQILIWSHPVSD